MIPLQSAFVFGDAQKDVTLSACLKTQDIKVQLPLLQPSKQHKLIKIEYKNKSEWYLDALGNKSGFTMKLDLNVVQLNKDTCEPTEIQLKRDKFSHFDKICSKIYNHVYMGSKSVAKCRKTLQENGITHVLNCVGFVCPEYFSKELSYKTLWLHDSPSEDITSVLYDVFDYFEEVREKNGHVFVHCCQGVSRSASLVIAYLMWVQQRSFKDVFKDLKVARGIANPNMGFACQLIQCQPRIHATLISPKLALRMYQLAPHSSYDPMHLVPKAIDNPHPHALDSRIVFVLIVPNVFFLWHGSKCDAYMVSVAHHFICQVVKYEKAKGDILHVVEGEEPQSFWTSFTRNHESCANGLQNHKNDVCLTSEFKASTKIVSSYNEDLVNYRKAKQCALMPPKAKVDYGTITGPCNGGWNFLPKIDRDESKNNILKIAENEEGNVLSPHEGEKQKIEDKHENFQNVLEPSSTLVSNNDSQISLLSSFSNDLSLSNLSPSSFVMKLPHSLCSCLLKRVACNTLFWHPKKHLISYLISANLSQIPSTPRTIFKTMSQDFFFKRSFSQKLPIVANDNKMSISQSFFTIVSKDLYLPKENLKSIIECDSLTCATNITYNNINTLETCVQNERLISSLNTPYTFQRGNQGESSSNTREISDKVAYSIPILYKWPQMETIAMFDVDDLDSNEAFVLLIPNGFDSKQGCLYLWVGSTLIAKGDKNSTLIASDIDQQSVEHWQQVGIDLIHQLELHKDTNSKVS